MQVNSAILSTFIKLPFVIIKIFDLSNFEWPLRTGLAVYLQKSLILRKIQNVSDRRKDRRMDEQCVGCGGDGGYYRVA